jgi:hypothetical protein
MSAKRSVSSFSISSSIILAAARFDVSRIVAAMPPAQLRLNFFMDAESFAPFRGHSCDRLGNSKQSIGTLRVLGFVSSLISFLLHSGADCFCPILT